MLKVFFKIQIHNDVRTIFFFRSIVKRSNEWRSTTLRSNVCAINFCEIKCSMIKKESLLFRYLSHFEFLVHSHSRIKVVIFSYLQYQFSDYHKQRKVTGFCLLVLNQSLLTIIKYPIKIDGLTSKKSCIRKLKQNCKYINFKLNFLMGLWTESIWIWITTWS